jgi:calcineurin-like phosphoesterase family protein
VKDCNDRNRLFFTADTHFGCRSQMIVFKRPFKKVAEMDRAMIERWNELIGPQDTVYHLGDFGIHRDFGPNSDQLGDIHAIFQLLNGHKILIMGNHDRESGPVWGLPWAHKTKEPMAIHVEGQEIWLTHFPPKGPWPGKDSGAWCLYGHVHGRSRPKPNCFDVGVDCSDFRPVGYAEIRERMELLKGNFRNSSVM